MHVIRLRKPWTKLLSDGGPAFRVDVPDQTVSDSELPGAVAHYRRRFNRPSGLDDARVFLRITGWHGRLKSLSLNQTPIPVEASATGVNTDVTSLLQPHNELVVSLLGTPAGLPRLSGEVSLGIDES